MEATIQSLESLIREGKTEMVRRRLAEFRHKKVARKDVLPLARLARTANVPDLAIRLLNPIVRPPAKSLVRPNDEEKAVYAAVLTRIGASGEALDIIKTLDAEKVPECLLYEAYARVTQWDYRGTIPLLLQYLRARGISPYQKIVGQVNLAAAYVHEKQSKPATALLGELRDVTQEKNLLQLYGNSLELSAQHAIFQERWDEALHYLAEADETLKKTGGLDAFFVRKWGAILEVLRNPRKTERLAEVRSDAVRLKHWETVRDCDRFECIGRKDAALFQHVYFGTPIVEFRERLKEDFEGSPDIPESFIRYFGKKIGSARELDFGALKEGQTLHRLFMLLNSDFYRPIRLASVHAALYPGEFFNPRSSPSRVHQVIKRLRRWISEKRLPLLVVEDSGAYRLDATGPLSLRMTLTIGDKRKKDFSLDKLRDSWPRSAFSSREAAEVLGISERSAVRLLQEGFEAGALVREGSARSTRYKF